MKVRIQSIERLRNNPLGVLNNDCSFKLERCLWQALNYRLIGRMCVIETANENGVEYFLNEVGQPKYFVFKEVIEEFL